MNGVAGPLQHTFKEASNGASSSDPGIDVPGGGSLPRWAGVARVLGFFLFTLLTLVIADRLIADGLRKIRTSTLGVMNGIVGGEINARILVTGSSRALTHVDSRVIQAATGGRTFNIGINGSQIDMQVAAFKTYLRHNVRPVLVIQSLDSYSFVTSHGGVDYPGQYMPFLGEAGIL